MRALLFGTRLAQCSGSLSPLVRRWAAATPASTAANRVPLVLADIGEGISEVEVLQWFVEEGERVKQFMPVVEVQSDKSTVEITSHVAGVVDELCYGSLETASVGSPLMYIIADPAPLPDALSSTPEAKKTEDAPPATGADKEAPPSSGLHASALPPWQPHAAGARDKLDRGLAIPGVRKLAEQHGLYVDAITGSGKDGRVTKRDVMDLVSSQEPELGQDTPRAFPSPSPYGPAAGIRLGDEVRMGLACALLAPSSVFPFYIKAVGVALRTHSGLLDGRRRVDIGVTLPSGLRGVLQSVDDMSVAEIESALTSLHPADQPAAATAARVRYDADAADAALWLTQTGCARVGVRAGRTVAAGGFGRVRGAGADAVVDVAWVGRDGVDAATLEAFAAAVRRLVEQPGALLAGLR
jgi:Biotin-requiring enzyme/e3 binding domain